MFVRELTDGQEIDQVLLVRERELRTKRDGAEYLRLSLGDRTGTVAGDRCASDARAGRAVRARRAACASAAATSVAPALRRRRSR